MVAVANSDGNLNSEKTYMIKIVKGPFAVSDTNLNDNHVGDQC